MQNSSEAPKIENAAPIPHPSMIPKKVSGLLLIGIIFLPLVFVWWLLGERYTMKARVIGFLWAGFALMCVLAPKSPSTAPSAHNAAAQESKTEVKDKQPAIGEAFRLGDFTYVVKSVSTTDFVGNQFSSVRPSPGGIFVIVDFQIKNEGNKTETVLTDDFKIEDSQSREYRTSSEVTTALAMSGGGNFMITEVQPGLSRRMKTGFEIPHDSLKAGVDLVIPEKRWGSGKVRISLRGK